MSTGGKKSNQHRDSQSGGAQMVGNPKPVDRARVPSFMGRSGKPDNQSTNRKQGST
jgi:hypothetical protein